MNLTLPEEMYRRDSKVLDIKRVIALKSKASNVAVVELATPMTFNQYVSPICLPEVDMRDNLKSFIDSWDFAEETNAFAEISEQTGFPTSPKTHFTIRKSKEGRCPTAPVTQLYSVKNYETAIYSVGVLHTQHAKFCAEGVTDSVLYDNLSVYAPFFKNILKDAKTCPPYQ
jgi:hypothetical protein